MRAWLAEREEPVRYPIRATFFGCCASAEAPKANNNAPKTTHTISLCTDFRSAVSRGRDRSLRAAPRTDPYVKDSLIRLLPRVHLTASRSFGYGCKMRAGGSQ